MGAWGFHAFENDDACDWAYELEKANDLSPIHSTFKLVNDDYLEAPEASNALAACEVLASLNGKPGMKDTFSEGVEKWVTEHPQTPPPELLTRATTVIDRILGEESELKELWQESDNYEQWLNSAKDLRQRLQTGL